ncbi:MAG: hypothetical protein NC201_01610 [Prevotella sp.]|nr:hypothetical protein [Bacteroides sp.]MCM1365925.1 hypothetical protein [Prevotella sp.]MCM1436654.1 hypothetical protein [Prevotella sp.]
MRKFTPTLAAALLLSATTISAPMAFAAMTPALATRADQTPALNINLNPGVITEISNVIITPAVADATLALNPEVSSTSTAELYKNNESFADFLVQIDGNSAILSLFNPVTASGEYSIVIPEGFFLVNNNPVPAQTFSGYTIEKKVIPQEIIVTPPAGTQVAEIEAVYVMWRGYDSVLINPDNMDYDNTKIYFEFGSEKIPTIANIEATDEYTIYTFTPQTKIQGEGRARLTVPADQIQINGANPSRDVSYYWNVKPEEGTSTLTYDPAPGNVSELGDVVIILPEDTETITRGSIASLYDIDIYRWDKDYNDYAMLGSYTARIDRDEMKIYLTCGQTFTEENDYKMTIPNGYFVINGKNTPAQTVLWHVDGTGSVSGIYVDDASYDVFSVNGAVILRDADQNGVRTLDKGLYIINGKKVIIK